MSTSKPEKSGHSGAGLQLGRTMTPQFTAWAEREAEAVASEIYGAEWKDIPPGNQTELKYPFIRGTHAAAAMYQPLVEALEFVLKQSGTSTDYNLKARQALADLEKRMEGK